MGILYNLYGKFLTWAGNIRIYPLGIVLLGKTSYNIKGQDMRQVLKVLKPGDVLLRAYENYVSSMFIPGKYAHSGIYLGNNQVLHVTSKGFVLEDILTFMRTDRLAVVRFKDEDSAVEAVVRAKVAYKRGTKYDFLFDTKHNNRFYCTEFVDYCYKYVLRSQKGKDYIIKPDDYVKTEFFETLWRK